MTNNTDKDVNNTMQMGSNETIRLAYRPELQGIRAVAVVAVLLFHFEFFGVAGGYLGVDIFFVLSGFLITSILGKSEKPLTFSVLYSFLLKRFWRIVPALFVTVFLTLIVGYFILPPKDYLHLSQEALSALLLISNHLFAEQTGYFNDTSSLKPLLHTWSLSVELQFYLLWSWLFFMLHLKKGLSLKKGILITFLLSLLVSGLLLLKDPDIVFFILPTRLWEFAIGGLAAFYQHHAAVEKMAPWANWINGLALSVIFAFFVMTSPDMSIQFQYAFSLCLAVGALIVMLPHSPIISRVLSSPVMLWLGMISYSLYLIHWPLIVFANYLFYPETPQWLLIVLFLICFPLSYLLYRSVEDPMRLYGRKQSKVAGLSGVFPLLIIFGFLLLPTLFITFSEGFPSRFSHDILAKIKNPYRTLEKRNIVLKAESSQKERSIVTDGVETVALWGDSHAGHFSEGVRDYFGKKGQKVLFFLKDSCLPVSGVVMKYSATHIIKKCTREKNDAIVEKIILNPQMTTVILAARWVVHIECKVVEKDHYRPLFFSENDWEAITCEDGREVFKAAFRKMVSKFMAHGKKVIIMGQVPEFGFDAARCSVLRALHSQSLSACFLSHSATKKRHQRIDQFFTSLTIDNPNVRYIRTLPSFCSKGVCRPALNNKLAYKDDDHILRQTGKALIAKLFSELPSSFGL